MASTGPEFTFRSGETIKHANGRQTGGAARSNGVQDAATVLARHRLLLERRPHLDDLGDINTTPIFTQRVRQYALDASGKSGKSSEQPFSQYGLIAADASEAAMQNPDADCRIFQNIAAPSSVFICGSQGSGKSHTLSCLLENCLVPSPANELPRPLTGVVFHYDTFTSDHRGAPCEAAYLSSNPNIRVRVLCPPTNIRTIKHIYSGLPNVDVETLQINESDLNTKRMLDLMAVTGGNMPLYLHVINRILRNLRVDQQNQGTPFSYSLFKSKVEEEPLLDAQKGPLQQRLDTLESFMVAEQTQIVSRKKSKARLTPKGNDWTPKAGQLTIVDLSCPCVTAEMACSLFNICLSLFLEQKSTIGLVVALDEAHKYMTDLAECHALTESLLATIRLQRHLGARVIISTQEPTISPALLDLCSVTIVHRFTSPEWLRTLRKHLAGVFSAPQIQKIADAADDALAAGLRGLTLGTRDPALELFPHIVGLRVGEALLFAPSAIIDVERHQSSTAVAKIHRLNHGVLKIRVRQRVTKDGGKSIMAG